MAKTPDDRNWDAVGLLITGGIVLGLGVGFLTDEVVAGLFIGLGGGFVASALLLTATSVTRR